ncbi:MAG: tripartite tricarboxylate transporter permease, partial [Pseudomonadota bacterium]
MLEAATAGLFMIFQWPAVGYLFFGIVLGLYFGAVPGLSGLSGMAILLPFTFGLDPAAAFAFLIGMYAVTTTSDSVASIMIGVPGTAASQATVLDGYPMTQRGEGARALGAAFTCSAIGGVLGALFMGVSIPLVQPLVLSFAMPEFFMLGVLGLTMVGALSGNSITKGLLCAALGVLASTVGYAEQMGIPRYWFGSIYLLDGLALVPVVLGLFAIPELIALAASGQSIAKAPQQQKGAGLVDGIRDVARHWWLVLRSSVIGIYIGILPALGAALADWVAYGHAVQSAKDKSRFGKGDVRGVIAPESANNAVKGGGLVPTVAFGIPGSPALAILLGAFMIQGLTPGPEMLSAQLPLTYSLMWMLAIANVVAALVLLAASQQIQKVAFVNGAWLVPAVVVFVFMGAWSGGRMGDWYTLVVFGAIGVVLKALDWPRAPFVLGFILGPIMENALHISIRAYGAEWLTRPIVLVLAALIVLAVLASVRRAVVDRRGRTPAAANRQDGSVLAVGTTSTVLLLCVGAVA